MLLPLLREMLHTPVLDILHHLKRSSGMSVGELSTRMKMSYMGVKQHCDDLVGKGMLDTFRRPKPSGRPEKLYRITHKLDPIFDDTGMSLALDLLGAAQRVYGETAAAKLLYTWFQAKSDALSPKIDRTESLLIRAKALARLRCSDGCISSVVQDESTGAISLVEHHQPLRELLEAHDIVDELECEMIERLLGCGVTRSREEVSGLVRVTFTLRE
ncbi:MAG: hypothetical protein IPK32_18135 [Verrucomicrobiaceae bacterium]|nr:hypothetical protein [Verrucomicrobiaceae bacterium]